jgi:hypothetical protein
MAVDLEAIRRRMAELNGTKKTSSVQLWKPGVGEYRIRCLPWKNNSSENPFMERWFYYIGTNAGILSPKQFNKPDPIDDLIKKLFSSGKPDDRLLAKKLLPKMRAYAPVIVRGQEDKGVMVWSFGKIVYQQLLGFFLDEDYGDILDPNEGFDLKVVISQAPGKQFQDTAVSCKPKASKLHDDSKQAQSWLDAVPNLDDMYRLKSKEEIESILSTWLSGGESSSGDEGTQRGSAAPKDQLDELVKDVRGAKAHDEPAAPKAEAVKPAKASPRKPKVDDDDASAAPVKKQTLDEAFDELMDNE